MEPAPNQPTGDVDALRELDAEIAREVFRWKVVRNEVGLYRTDDLWTFDNQMGFIPDYSTDPNDAFDMEEEIQRRGLANAYGKELDRLLRTETFLDGSPVGPFAIAHASPRDRCRAALRAVRQSKAKI